MAALSVVSICFCTESNHLLMVEDGEHVGSVGANVEKVLVSQTGDGFRGVAFSHAHLDAYEVGTGGGGGRGYGDGHHRADAGIDVHAHGAHVHGRLQCAAVESGGILLREQLAGFDGLGGTGCGCGQNKGEQRGGINSRAGIAHSKVPPKVE